MYIYIYIYIYLYSRRVSRLPLVEKILGERLTGGHIVPILRHVCIRMKCIVSFEHTAAQTVINGARNR